MMMRICSSIVTMPSMAAWIAWGGPMRSELPGRIWLGGWFMSGFRFEEAKAPDQSGSLHGLGLSMDCRSEALGLLHTTSLTHEHHCAQAFRQRH